MSAIFGDLLAQLTEPVRSYLTEQGFTDHQTVADSATPQYLKDADGSAVEKSADIVFVESLAEQVSTPRPGTPSWAKALRFYRACYAAAEEPAVPPDAAPLEAKDFQVEEYYELNPECRRKRLQALHEARQFEVEEARLASRRLFGKYEKIKRVNKEFEPLLPDKVQSEEIGKRRSPQPTSAQSGAEIGAGDCHLFTNPHQVPRMSWRRGPTSWKYAVLGRVGAVDQKPRDLPQPLLVKGSQEPAAFGRIQTFVGR